MRAILIVENLNNLLLAFAEDENLPYAENGNGIKAEVMESIPDWVVEVADDMDVYVAQRDFEEAVSLAEKNKIFWEKAANSSITNLHRDLKYDLCGMFHPLVY